MQLNLSPAPLQENIWPMSIFQHLYLNPKNNLTINSFKTEPSFLAASYLLWDIAVLMDK